MQSIHQLCARKAHQSRSSWAGNLIRLGHQARHWKVLLGSTRVFRTTRRFHVHGQMNETWQFSKDSGGNSFSSAKWINHVKDNLNADGWDSAFTHTIYALSTPPGRSAVAVIRVSGPKCKAIYASLCPGKNLPAPRYAAVRSIYVPQTCEPIKYKEEKVIDPAAIVLFFPAPRSITGQDILELHLHGGPAVIQAALRSISECNPKYGTSSIRPAEPGEFTKRAFMSGRLDLPQAESLGALLEAETEQQRLVAVRTTQGSMASRYEDWRQRLIDARGRLEAVIDFAEDQQFEESPHVLVANVRDEVKVLQSLVSCSLQNAVRGELLKNGIRVTVLGRPNAGKSSLLNALVGREAAIVSDYQGTTRDVIEICTDINGWAVRFSDTAGLRSIRCDPNQDSEMTIHPVEIKGMEKAIQQAVQSDVLIFLLSIEHSANSKDITDVVIGQNLLEQMRLCLDQKRPLIVAINKADTLSVGKRPIEAALAHITARVRSELDKSLSPDRAIHIPIVEISCKFDISLEPEEKARSGIQQLCSAMSDIFRDMTRATGPDTNADQISGQNLVDLSLWQEALGTTERQRFLLTECQDHLANFLRSSEIPGENAEGMDIVLAAEYLRSAADCLARITGKGDAGDVEEILGVVFSK